jgi:CBS domain-containing protein
MKIIRLILDLKGHDVYSISPEQAVFEALKVMAKLDIGALLVMEKDKLIGIISERDYARKVILKGRSSKDTPVKQIMTRKVTTIHPDQTIEEAMQIMTSGHFRHIPVVDNERVIGVISLSDVVSAIITHQRDTIKFYEEMEKEI